MLLIGMTGTAPHGECFSRRPSAVRFSSCRDYPVHALDPPIDPSPVAFPQQPATTSADVPRPGSHTAITRQCRSFE